MVTTDLSIFPIKIHQASLNLFFTEYRAVDKKKKKQKKKKNQNKTQKAHIPHENKTEHPMSHTVLSRGRMKEKGINHVWQMLMKHRDTF